MKRLLLLLLALTLCPALFTESAWAERPVLPARNPALIYWQALALMPVLSLEQNALMLEVTTGKRGAECAGVSVLLTNTEKSLTLAQRASTAGRECDWGILYEDGPFTVMPHINGMQQLSRLALVKAERLFTEGNQAEALGWILMAHRAARHTASADMLMSALVQFGIESQCVAMTGRHVLALNSDERAGHLRALRELPPLRTVVQAFQGELHYVDWAEQEFQGATEATEAAALMERLKAGQAAGSTNDLSPAPPESEEVKNIREEFAKKPLPQMMEETRSLYQKTISACAKPWKTGLAELETLQAEIQDHGNYIVRLIYPSVVATRERELRLETERTMLMAALTQGDTMKEGPLEGFQDTLNELPLVVEKGEGGWVIKMVAGAAPITGRVPVLKVLGTRK